MFSGIDLDQLKQFASEFKEARQKIGLTQTQVRYLFCTDC